LENHEERIAALEAEFQKMGNELNSKIQKLQDVIGSMGSVPTSSKGG
jgi:peptidoglycan hydrolase CwlO-like protein